MKKVLITALILSALLCTACSTGNNSSADNSTTSASSASEVSSASESSEAAVSVIKNDATTKWTSADRTFEFNTDGSGSITDNGAETSVPVSYEINGTEFTLKTGSEDNVEKATAEAKDDNTIVLKWSDGKEETLTLATGSAEAAVSVIKNNATTKWTSADRTFEFNTDGSGSITDNGAETSVPISYEINGTELTLKVGSEDNVEKATAEAKDDNTIVLKWSDGKEETLTLATNSAEAAISVIRNDATTKWTSADRTFEFNTDGSGSITDNGAETSVPVSYEINGTEFTLKIGSEDNVEKATAEAKDDNTIVLKWSDGKEETLTLATNSAEAAISVIRNDATTKWTSADRTFEFNTDGSGSITDNGAETSVPISYEINGTEFTLKVGSEDNVEKAAAEAKDDNTIVLKWSDGKEETLTLATNSAEAAISVIRNDATTKWTSTDRTFEFNTDGSGSITDNGAETSVPVSYEINGTEFTLKIGSEDNVEKATAEAKDDNTIVLKWSDGKEETLTLA